MTDRVTVRFKVEDGTIARADESFTKAHGKRKAFHKGSNSSLHHWAIPRDIWRVMEEEKEAEKQGRLTQEQQQKKLSFQTVTGPREFTRAGVLHAVTKLIATNCRRSL